MFGFIDIKGWVTGAIDAFLDIFRTAAEEIIDLGITALLQIGRPEFTSNWFVSMYASIFGLMLAISVVRSLFVAVKGFGTSNPRTLFRAFTHSFKYFMLAKWLPYLFMVGFSVSAVMSQEIASMMPVEAETGEPSIVGMGILAAEIFLLPVLVVQSVLFYIEVLLIQWLLPYCVVMYLLVKTGFSEISTENKSFSRALNLGIVTMGCQVMMVTVMVVGSIFIEAVGVQTDGSINSQIFSRWVILTVTMAMPWIVYKSTKKTIVHLAEQKATQVHGQVKAITQASTVQRADSVNLTKLSSGVAAESTKKRLEGLGKPADPMTVGSAVTIAKTASSMAGKASAAKGGAAASAAGPLAVAAVVTTQIAASKVKKRMEERSGTPTPRTGG